MPADAADLNGKNILIVEDETIIALLLEDMLSDLGCRVVATAPSLDAALAMVDSVTADAAVLDVNVAGREVFPVAERLRARGIPIVFSTGYGAGGLPPEWRGNAVIAKPFDAADLGKALLQTLAGK